MKILHILLVIGIKLKFSKTFVIRTHRKSLWIMQDSILVISARSPARVPVFPQLAYSLPGQKKQQLKTRGCIPPSNKIKGRNCNLRNMSEQLYILCNWNSTCVTIWTFSFVWNLYNNFAFCVKSEKQNKLNVILYFNNDLQTIKSRSPVLCC